MKQKDLPLFLSLPLIMLFAYTAISKLLEPTFYRQAMHNQPLPEPLINLLLWAVPTVELLTVVLLLILPLRGWGFTLASGLMTAFTGYVLLILGGYFDYVPCSCGGILAQLSWEQHLWVNLLFLSLALYGLYITLKPTPTSTIA
jgi:uncharacterized membrane protein YphA (DoxX/SURF4 family)